MKRTALIRRTPLRRRPHRKSDVPLRERRGSMFRGGRDRDRGRGWAKRAEKIRARDLYRCQRCGKSEEENGQKLSVDHIIPWRVFEDKDAANVDANLTSLCKSCHSHKTSRAEQRWLRGDRHDFSGYVRAIRLLDAQEPGPRYVPPQRTCLSCGGERKPGSSRCEPCGQRVQHMRYLRARYKRLAAAKERYEQNRESINAGRRLKHKRSEKPRPRKAICSTGHLRVATDGHGHCRLCVQARKARYEAEGRTVQMCSDCGRRPTMATRCRSCAAYARWAKRKAMA